MEQLSPSHTRAVGLGISLNQVTSTVATWLGLGAISTLTLWHGTVFKSFDCRAAAIFFPPVVFFILGRRLIYFHDYTLMWIMPLCTNVCSVLASDALKHFPVLKRYEGLKIVAVIGAVPILQHLYI